MLDQLAAAVSRHRNGLWSGATAVPRLGVVALDEVINPLDVRYEPMVCFIAEGAKRTITGEHSRLARRGEMFLNSLHLPVTAVFEEVPYRSVVLHLDGPVLAGLLLELDGEDPAAAVAGTVSATMGPELLDAVTRWVRLLDTPGDIRPLAARVEVEILYRLLGSPLGPTLRQFAATGSALTRVRAAADWITAHFSEPITVQQVAAVAHMSPATLHRHFKVTTGMSPLRFQKHLRLQEARRLLVAGDTTAAHTAEAVGYVSATQFTREYRRAYGLPPMRDAARLRNELVDSRSRR
ncbi:AraC family transcriptional regulator [Umezawaea beigongshangensis]|uniref:AraC family transcriptional regulator n=1 Tax=Umezawaea beigongshangensis TaxID=2780383 RepID=UPI0018F1640F|nr:AraC family transcriptional regulator [Umezawaea beigongshangensis]